MRRLEEAALSLDGKFAFKDSETGEISTNVVDHLLIVSSGVSSGSAVIELDKDVPNQINADLMTEYLLNHVGNMPGLKSITFSSGTGFGGNRISFQLVSEDAEDFTMSPGYARIARTV